MFFSKLFCVVCLAAAAVLCACAEEYFVVRVKPYPCDYELRGTFTSETGVTRVQTDRHHGRFAIASDMNSVMVIRPDLGVTPEGMVSVGAEEGSECVVNYEQAQERPAEMVFLHKEEDTVNGKACFKYFNESERVFWYDAEGNELGKEYPEEESENGTMSVLFYDVEPFTRETFVLPEGYKCTAKPEAFQAPSEEVFAAECSTTPSSSSSSSSVPSPTPSSGSTPVSPASVSPSTSGASALTLFPLLAVVALFL